MTSESKESIRVLIVDDHPVIRMGAKLGIEQSDDIRVVAEAKSGEEAVKLATQVRPNVILMDIGLPGMDGIEAASRITKLHQEARVVMFTANDTEDYIAASIAAGAMGYCLKGAEPERLRLAIRSVCAGAIWFDALIGRKITTEYCRNRTEKSSHVEETAGNGGNRAERFINLTERELEVLELLAAGLSNQELASQLNISVSTAKTHVSRILKHLDVSDRTQAAVKALRLRIVNDVGDKPTTIIPS